MPGHFVYIIRCADGSLYTGYAVDPPKRVLAHNRGRGAKYTAGRRPVELLYSERFRTKGRALRRELQIKGLTRHQKEALITAAPPIAHPRSTDRQPSARSRARS